MKQSESIADLASALSKAQGQIKPAKMDKVGYHKNKYASLGSIWDVCRKPLADNGLSIVQSPISPLGDPDTVGLTTTLLHLSGQSMTDTLYLRMADDRNKNSVQVAGSNITYMRRYALSAMLGIVADEDNDGNAPKNGGGEPAGTVLGANGEKRITPAQFIQLCVDNLCYTGSEHVRATMNLFKIKAVPNDADKRKHLYVDLKDYRQYRDVDGLDRDDALAAVEGDKE